MVQPDAKCPMYGVQPSIPPNQKYFFGTGAPCFAIAHSVKQNLTPHTCPRVLTLTIGHITMIFSQPARPRQKTLRTAYELLV